MNDYYVAGHEPDFVDEATLKSLFEQGKLAKVTGYDRYAGDFKSPWLQKRPAGTVSEPQGDPLMMSTHTWECGEITDFEEAKAIAGSDA